MFFSSFVDSGNYLETNDGSRVKNPKKTFINISNLDISLKLNLNHSLSGAK